MRFVWYAVILNVSGIGHAVTNHLRVFSQSDRVERDRNMTASFKKTPYITKTAPQGTVSC